MRTINEECDSGDPQNFCCEDNTCLSSADVANTCIISANDNNCDNKKFKTICPSNCGNGLKIAAEECDDFNTESGDGCDEDCLLEDNYVCVDGAGVEIPLGCVDN